MAAAVMAVTADAAAAEVNGMGERERERERLGGDERGGEDGRPVVAAGRATAAVMGEEKKKTKMMGEEKLRDCATLFAY